jgi:nitrate reductase molybdenum cofactor assembly chaperone NarJ/NarW
MRRPEARTVFGCASVLLSYPDEETFASDVAAVADAAHGIKNRAARTHLEQCCRWLGEMTALDAAATYVDAFDMRRRRTLYVTFYRYGDTRERGMALAALVSSFRNAGFALAPGELPDFLPALLELAASHPDGAALLAEYRPAIDTLRAELEDAHSDYAGAVAAIGDALAPLDRNGRAVLSRYRQEGPPSERVGLEPFVPPEILVPVEAGSSNTTVVFSHK